MADLEGQRDRLVDVTARYRDTTLRNLRAQYASRPLVPVDPWTVDGAIQGRMSPEKEPEKEPEVRETALERLDKHKGTVDGCAIIRETKHYPVKLDEVPALALLVSRLFPATTPSPTYPNTLLFAPHSKLWSAYWATVGWLPFKQVVPGVLLCQESPLYSLVVAGLGGRWKRRNQVGFFTAYLAGRSRPTGILVVPLPVWKIAEELVEKGLPPILPHYASSGNYVYNLGWDEPCVGEVHARFLGGLPGEETKVMAGLLSGWFLDTPGPSHFHTMPLHPLWVEKLAAVGREFAEKVPRTTPWDVRRNLGMVYARKVPFALEVGENGREIVYRKVTKLSVNTSGVPTVIEVGECGPAGEPVDLLPPETWSHSTPVGCSHPGVYDEDLHTCVACGIRVCEECGRECEACGEYLCDEHLTECPGCGCYYCSECGCEACMQCVGCEGWRASEDAYYCAGCESGPYCAGCVEACCPHCAGCGDQYQKEDLGMCPHCKREDLCLYCREHCECEGNRLEQEGTDRGEGK